MIPAPYRRLMGIRRARLPVIAAAVGRLPLGSESLATLFLVREATGSFASAGLVEACFSIGAAVGLPLQGRLVDRVGQTRILLPAAILNASSLVAMVLAANGDAPLAVLAALGACAGLAVPALSASMRGLWAVFVEDHHLLQSAYALDAVILELAFIGGPVLAAGLTATISPSAAVLAGVALTLGGTTAFAASRASRAWRAAGAPRHRAGALRAPGIRVLAFASIGFGFANGVLTLALTAFGADHGHTEIVGLYISIQAVASMVGGLWYGARRWSTPPEERYAEMNLLLALGFAPLVLVPSMAVMGGLMVFAGLAIAPATAVEYMLIARLAPAGTSTEAFGWVTMATVLGVGLGEAAGGAIVNGGHIALGFGAAFAGAAFAWAASRVGQPWLRRAQPA